jgi:hypothetical protein
VLAMGSGIHVLAWTGSIIDKITAVYIVSIIGMDRGVCIVSVIEMERSFYIASDRGTNRGDLWPVL